MSSIGTRMTELRKSRGLTQEQLADAFGVSSQAVSKWENDISCPDISMLPQIADFFHVTIDELLRGRPEGVQMIDKEQLPHKDLGKMLLKVIVDSKEGDRVRVNLPMQLVKMGLEVGLSMPEVAGNKALENLDLHSILSMVEQGVIGKLVEVDSSDGEHVEVLVE